MARQSAGGMPGRLIAVQRHVGVKLPMRYEISAKNLMMPGTPFSGPFIVQARIDRDGDPMTKGNDDLYAQAAGPVKGGESDVALVLGPRKAGGAASQPAAAPKAGGAASQPAAAPKQPAKPGATTQPK